MEYTFDSGAVTQEGAPPPSSFTAHALLDAVLFKQCLMVFKSDLRHIIRFTSQFHRVFFHLATHITLSSLFIKFIEKYPV